jgi:histone-lysine N-methyltransferase SETD1
MSKRSFADFFPTAPSVLQEKRKAARDRRKPVTESTSNTAESGPSSNANSGHAPVDDTQSRTQSQTRFAGSPDQGEHLSPPRDAGDLLNGVGSASSLASTTSSLFSNPVGTKGKQDATEPSLTLLTPLTSHESSPPLSHPSPNDKHRITSSSHVNGANGSGDIAPPIEASNMKLATTHDASGVLPATGKSRGMKILYDPDLDPELPVKDKRKAKPRYGSFSEEVSSMLLCLETVTSRIDG